MAFADAGQIRDAWMKLKDFESLTADQKAIIQEVSTKTTKRTIMDGEGTIEEEFVKVKLYDKQKSLDSLSNILGFNAPVKNEVFGKGGKDLIPAMNLGNLTDEELKQYCLFVKKSTNNGDG